MWQNLGCSPDSDLIIDVNIFYSKSTCAALAGDCFTEMRDIMEHVDQFFLRDFHIRIRPTFCELQEAENHGQGRLTGQEFLKKINELALTNDCSTNRYRPGMYLLGTLQVNDRRAGLAYPFALCGERKNMVGYTRLEIWVTLANNSS